MPPLHRAFELAGFHGPDGHRVTIPAQPGTARIETDAELLVVSFTAAQSHDVELRIGGGALQVGP
jgi:hypothetical protein